MKLSKGLAHKLQCANVNRPTAPSGSRPSRRTDSACAPSPYQWNKNTGAIAASAAPTCRARMGTACRGDCGTHLIAKYNTMGAWAAMRSCQMWAAAPSSVWGAVPCKATKINTVARATRDIATGRKALGCFSVVHGRMSPPYGFAGGGRSPMGVREFRDGLVRVAQRIARRSVTGAKCFDDTLALFKCTRIGTHDQSMHDQAAITAAGSVE